MKKGIGRSVPINWIKMISSMAECQHFISTIRKAGSGATYTGGTPSATIWSTGETCPMRFTHIRKRDVIPVLHWLKRTVWSQCITAQRSVTWWLFRAIRCCWTGRRLPARQSSPWEILMAVLHHIGYLIRVSGWKMVSTTHFRGALCRQALVAKKFVPIWHCRGARRQISQLEICP